MKRILSVFLITVLLSQFAAGLQFTARAAETLTLQNDSVSVTVSGDNGGFAIRTAGGDALNKTDDEKDLLYRSGLYDTSFTSFQVTYANGAVREYVFGENYGYLGWGGVLTVAQAGAGAPIVATWTVDGLIFTQHIELANIGSAEHGMVQLHYRVRNTRADAVSVKARVLLDTALGDRDYAHYEVMRQGGGYRSIAGETLIGQGDFIPLRFFAYDDIYAPQVTAQTVNGGLQPYQLAFGHWYNLARTAFDFTPDSALNFTSAVNAGYGTADSACAMYYDMGRVPAGTEGESIDSYYGVFSNSEVETGDVAVNYTAPAGLQLTGDRKQYVRAEGMPGGATFKIQAQVENPIAENAKVLPQVTLAVYTAVGFTALDAEGGALTPAPTYDDPYTRVLYDLPVGGVRSLDIFIQADVGAGASYRRIELRAYDTSGVAAGSESLLTAENLLGSTSFYVLCPGGDGTLPQVTFTGLSPDILYESGTRHLYLRGRHLGLLSDTSRYALYAVNISWGGEVLIPPGNIFFDDEGAMDIVLTEPMLGRYRLEFRLDTDLADMLGCDTTLRPPAEFYMSGDKQYSSDYYSIVAVAQKGAGAASTYHIETYKDEAALAAARASGAFTEFLLVLRGDFVRDDTALDTGGRFTATVLDTFGHSGSAVTVNNCVDLENGIVEVYYRYEGLVKTGVCVDLDGTLYTSGAHTGIWQGPAVVTELTDGTDFGLRPYNRQGVPAATNVAESPVRLVWSSYYGIAQTLAGLVLKLNYGQFGVMYDTESTLENVMESAGELGHVLSFSAGLDLGFVIPKSAKAKELARWEPKDTSVGVFFVAAIDTKGQSLRMDWEKYSKKVTNVTADPNARAKAGGQLNVMVDNVLFGCGVGFIGVNFSVDVTLPAYTENLPMIQGTLKVNTIGDWSFGVKGSAAFATMAFEVDIAIRSRGNIPVPDKLYFFVTGFEPGINVDGFGILWITGGGGGFDKLYDTIFNCNGVPPLKLLLSVTMDVLKVLSGRMDLSVGLRGVSFKMSNVKIKGTTITPIKNLSLQLDWYPDIYLAAAIHLSLLDIIEGQGYMVLLNNEQYKGFFEAFARVSVKIPKAIPVVGGLEVLQADVGLNNEKIWGAATVIAVKVSVAYYWGSGDVDFNLGGPGSGPKPTFPALLGHEAVPVYYDEETGETLYLRVGANLAVSALAERVDDLDAVPALLAAEDALYTDATLKNHRLALGTFSGQGRAVSIDFAAQSREDALTAAQAMIQTLPFGLVLSDGTNPDTANANLIFDEGKASLSFTVTDPALFEREYDFTTPRAADLVLYTVGSLPEITAVDAARAGDTVGVHWTGADAGTLDAVSFYLVPQGGAGDPTQAGVFLGAVTEKARLAAGSASFPLPDEAPSGSYRVRAVYSQPDAASGAVESAGLVSVVNGHQPAAPAGVAAAPAGDMRLRVAVANADTAGYDGCLVNVYEETPDGWTLTDVDAMPFEREEGVMEEIQVGGHYMDADENGNPLPRGLRAGGVYRVGVTSYNKVDRDGDQVVDYFVRSEEVLSAPLTMPAPTPPAVTLGRLSPSVSVPHTEWGQDENGNAAEIEVMVETYDSPDVHFALTADMDIEGKWYLGDDEFGAQGMMEEFGFQQSVPVDLTGLADGRYTLTALGTNRQGDGFRATKVFAVDTAPPRLLLSAPLSGGSFPADGLLAVAGQTDAGALFSWSLDGGPFTQPRTVTALGGTIDPDGLFQFRIPLDPAAAGYTVVLKAQDSLGLSATGTFQVQNQLLGAVERLEILFNGERATDDNYRLHAAVPSAAALTLVGVAGSRRVVLPGRWELQTVAGRAQVDDDGRFTAEPGSLGMVVGRYEVVEGGFMTAAASFGAESQFSTIDDIYKLTLSAGLGGAVQGAGDHRAGDTVTITAVPGDGYAFTGWVVTAGAVTLANPGAATTTFVMPEGHVGISAGFSRTGGGGSGGYSGGSGGVITLPDEQTPAAGPGVKAAAGELARVDMDGLSRYSAPYYTVGGTEVAVKMSAVLGGVMYFIAPVTADYEIRVREKQFADTVGHWADDSIKYAYARGLFTGVSEDMFRPGGTMTRAMFVTVLGRLAAISEADYGTGPFRDVPVGAWYSYYVNWAAEQGIVLGYGDGRFGPDDPVTRAQMCALFIRFADHFAYELPQDVERTVFADDAKIAAWAREAVYRAQQAGLVVGRNDGAFCPDDSATRAEAAAVFQRLIERILLSIENGELRMEN
ncbi:MAG: S-layer homology domain-containing protein [Oscillospiraceae bacterium]|jgi:hypothetical protein|nr:S-layer homology domain-containing protein [Oscillospiraceae bacterium]